jgi:PAS domain S-box-containing protein
MDSHQNAELAKLIMAAPVAIITLSTERIITSWNHTASNWFDVSITEAQGRHAESALPQSLLDDLDNLQQTLLQSDARIVDHECEVTTKNGTVPMELDYSNTFDETGTISGTVCVLRDVSVRKEAEKRISEFYSVISHELRTPLASIRGSLRLIESGVLAPSSAEAAELVQVARESADRLIRLVNDILDLKKIESGKMELHRTEIDVVELVSEAIQSLAGLAQESSVSLVYDPVPLGCLNADWDKTTQIITNLLSNAIKYSPEGGQVVVTAAPSNDFLRIGVEDNGPGISPEDIDKLFAKFQQLDKSDRRHLSGTGLGLAITKALVEQQGGTIGIESTVGSGSRFWFEIPRYGRPGNNASNLETN